MTMEQISFSFRSSVFGVLKTLCVKAAQNKLDLIYDVDPRIPDQLTGDPLRLRQVITNLVGNAVKVRFSPLPFVCRRRSSVSLTRSDFCCDASVHHEGSGRSDLSTG